MNKAGIIKGEKTSDNFVAGKVKDFVVYSMKLIVRKIAKSTPQS